MTCPYFLKLRADEELLAVAREHAVTRVFPWLLFTIWLLVPFFFLFPLLDRGVTGITGFGFILVTGLLYGWSVYRGWMGTVLVVTNKRLIDVEQSGLFSRRITDISFKRIEEVTRQHRGLGSVIFHYGMLTIVTAGEAADIVCSRVPNVDRLAELIEYHRHMASVLKAQPSTTTP